MNHDVDAMTDAIMSSARENPRSVVGDLMVHFDAPTVIKILKIFSGKSVRFPKLETVWTHYRNRVIVDTLNVKNTKAIREQLSSFFAVSPQTVADVYAKAARGQGRGMSRTKAEEAAETVYRVGKDDFAVAVSKVVRK